MISINAHLVAGHTRNLTIDRFPDTCPLCNHSASVDSKYAFASGSMMQIVCRCPRDACSRLFIGYYVRQDGSSYYLYMHSEPGGISAREFSSIISSISQQFCDIYNQANAAEQKGLTMISGVGYRKALEFLLKDYFIKIHPEKVEEIKKTHLSKCIELYSTSKKVTEVAKRATWIANDETHYQKIWDKDLHSLKVLIDLTLHWIEDEHLTEEALQDMPEKK